jgi:glutamate synthase (NADPH) GltB2 subunit (EC 1.4.1.13)
LRNLQGILDWLRSDGAQVTRPPIDPYREDIDTSFLLNKGKAYLSLPVIFNVIGAPKEIAESLSWASYALGSMVFVESTVPKYSEISFSNDGKGKINWSYEIEEGYYLALKSEDEIDDTLVNKGIPGFIIDEDVLNEDLELVVSDVDTKLKEAGVRNKFDIIAKSSKLRDSADVFKLVALGADAVIMPYQILEIAIGEGSKGNLKERAFNLISGMKKEIALMAGAAGVYSVQSSLTGNRELLRAVNLNSYIARRIRVKQAGSL